MARNTYKQTPNNAGGRAENSQTGQRPFLPRSLGSFNVFANLPSEWRSRIVSHRQNTASAPTENTNTAYTNQIETSPLRRQETNGNRAEITRETAARIPLQRSPASYNISNSLLAPIRSPETSNSESVPSAETENTTPTSESLSKDRNSPQR